MGVRFVRISMHIVAYQLALCRPRRRSSRRLSHRLIGNQIDSALAVLRKFGRAPQNCQFRAFSREIIDWACIRPGSRPGELLGVLLAGLRARWLVPLRRTSRRWGSAPAGRRLRGHRRSRRRDARTRPLRCGGVPVFAAATSARALSVVSAAWWRGKRFAQAFWPSAFPLHQVQGSERVAEYGYALVRGRHRHRQLKGVARRHTLACGRVNRRRLERVLYAESQRLPEE
jgi:hypothetical protein